MKTRKVNNLYFSYGHLISGPATGLEIARALKDAGLIEITEVDEQGQWVRYAELPELYRAGTKGENKLEAKTKLVQPILRQFKRSESDA